MAKYSSEHIYVSGQKLDVRVYQEYRDSIRYTVGKKYIILRLPVGSMLGPMKEFQLKKLQQWVAKRVKEDPGILVRLVPRVYKDGELLVVMDHEYRLVIEEGNRKNVTAKIKGTDIIIKCPLNAHQKAKQDAIREVIIKLINKAYLPVVTHRVHMINDRFFHEPLEKVSLKYNVSNWGSCSSNRNINLSSRLLLTNRDVIDYVIVHELAHLKEMNHSKAFWDIVGRVMPDYERYENWLDDHGSKCHF